MKKALALLLVSGAVSAQTYTEIDYNNPPPANWPDLRQEVVYGSEEQMKRWCARIPEQTPQGKIIGCAKVYFEWDLCMIFLSTDDPKHLEHEQAHCRGYVHVGEGDRAHKSLREWLAKKRM